MNRSLLLIVFLSLISIEGFSQLRTNREILESASKKHRLTENMNYAQALVMAKKKGWSISITTKNGKKGSLIGVDALGFPKYYISQNNTIAAATTRANQLWPGGASGLNLSGSTAALKNKLAIWDEGIVLATHVEMIGRITQKDQPSTTSDHSTHVAGTMMASGVNPNAKGMAFGIQGLIAYDFNNDVSEMMGEASNIILSNHSYGIISGWNYNSSSARWEFYGRPKETEDYKFGYYSSDAQMLDSIAYNAPNYLIVKAAGNNRSENGPKEGDPYFRFDSTFTMVSVGARPAGISNNDMYNTIPWDGNAKNILTVGAVNGLPSGYARKEDVVMTNFSNWGPTDDGRIKPDLVADGVDVLSSVATSNTSYASNSGTSMATPNVTGSLFLLQEYYSKLKAGAFMRSATLKGLAIHTANEAGVSDGPDYKYGWGLLNVESAAVVINAAVSSSNGSNSNHLLYENVLNNGQTYTTNVVASGKGALVATISWTDPKGTVETVNVLNNPAKKLVNDLDIRITKGSSIYKPWVLDPNFPASSATRGDNILDNVEQVKVDSVVPGQTYTIKVTHKNTLERGQQAYSLLVSGVGGAAYCASAPTSPAGARIDSVSFKTIHYANPIGCTNYTDNTNISTDIESAQTIPVFVKTGTCDGSANPRIVTIYIDYNNNGIFEASEKVAQSAAIASSTGGFTGSITTPAGLTVGNLYLMRMIVQETSNTADVNGCGSYNNGETEDFRLKVTAPSNDLSIDQLIAPTSGSCAVDSQYVTISIKNNGAIDQTNVPVSLLVKNGATTVLSISSFYTLTIPALSSVRFTFSTPFASTPSTTYTITSTVSLTGDQNVSNNTNTSSVVIPSKPVGPSGTGIICNGSAILKVTNPTLAANYFWYNSSTSTIPFASGYNTSTTSIPTNNTFYVGTEVKGTVGLSNKMAYPNGGYNAFSGQFVNFNNSVPLIIETARLYIGNPGTITFTIANFNGWSDTSHTNYSYFPISSTKLNVYPTTPSPVAGAVSGNNTADTGAIYYLNLPVPSTGDHIIIVDCQNGANIFRNNGISNNPYPFTLPSVISLTGNSAATNTFPNNFQGYYYWFYNMKVNTGDCVSDRSAIIATTIPTPVITQVADSLTSSILLNNQWYRNDTLIAGATDNHFKPTKSGTYKSNISDLSGCIKSSNAITFLATALNDVLVQEIKLIVSPNPSRGPVKLSFEMTVKKDMTIEIFNSVGQRVIVQEYPGFIGKFNNTIELSGFSSDLYTLKIRHNNKNYLQKILIQK